MINDEVRDLHQREVEEEGERYHKKTHNNRHTMDKEDDHSIGDHINNNINNSYVGSPNILFPTNNSINNNNNLSSSPSPSLMLPFGDNLNGAGISLFGKQQENGSNDTANYSTSNGNEFSTPGGNKLFVNTSSLSKNRDSSINRRKRHGQSKSVSYSNLSMFQPQQQQQQQQQSLSASNSNEQLNSVVYDEEAEYIIEYCSVLKDRLKQLATQLERDQSEMNHKDQEIDLLNNRINRYNKELAEGEEENEKLQARVQELEKMVKGDKSIISKLTVELEEVKSTWVSPSEASMWSEQIESITGDLESKDEIIDSSNQKIEALTEQVKREREVSVIARTEAENAQRQYRTEREEYFKELDSLRAKVSKMKSKMKKEGDKLKVKDIELESGHKTIEKMKQQLSTSELEVIEQRHLNEKLQAKLADEQRRFLALSSSQNLMSQELKEVEGERLAIIGLMNKNETEIEERVTLLVQECAKANETIAQRDSKIRELESTLTNEKLNKYISSISLSDTNYTIGERQLIRMIQEKDEEIQRINKQIQRLQIDSSTISTRYKKLEESMNDNHNQLQTTKKSLRNSRKELSKMSQELLYLSDENYNESLYGGGNIQSNYNKRKSFDFSELSKLIHQQQELEDEDNNNQNNGSTAISGSSSGKSSTFNSSPLKNHNLLSRKERGLSSPQPISNIQQQLLAQQQSNQNSSIGDSPNENSILAGSSPTSKMNYDQLEDRLERARSANIGYRLHIQFLSKEIRSLEKEQQQQKDYHSRLMTRLNLDLEEARRMNSRVRKAFLQRFAKEDDSIYLDYYTLTDKFHPPISNTLQLEISGHLNNSGNGIISSPPSSSISTSSSSSSTSLSSSSNSVLSSTTTTQSINSTPSLSSTITSTYSSPLPPLKSALKQSPYIQSSSQQSLPNLSPIPKTTNSNSSYSKTNVITSNNSNNNIQNNNSNSGSNNNSSYTTKPRTPTSPSIDLSKQCNRCSKEFSIFTRKHQCTSCSMNYCYECCNTKTKICVFCNSQPKP